jgi:hypothetical protein
MSKETHSTAHFSLLNSHFLLSPNPEFWILLPGKYHSRNPKHETNPNDQNLNDQNGTDWNLVSSFCLGHWRIRLLNLFRISIFGFRIYLHALCPMSFRHALCHNCQLSVESSLSFTALRHKVPATPWPQDLWHISCIFTLCGEAACSIVFNHHGTWRSYQQE